MYNTNMNLHINYRLYVIMMGQYKFISCNICTTMMGNIDEVDEVSCGGWEIGSGQGYMGTLYFLLNFTVSL